MMQNAPDSVW